MSKTGFTSRCADRATKSDAFESNRHLAFSPDWSKKGKLLHNFKIKKYEK